MKSILFLVLAIGLLSGCKPGAESTNKEVVNTQPSDPANEQTSDKTIAKYRTTGSVERLDPALDELISPDAIIEVLAEGFTWTEGPLWIAEGDYLLFSDIPPNSVFKWTEENGVELYLKPSGYTGSKKRGGEPGSNGLLLGADGHLVLCQHGDRQIGRMVTALDDPQPVFQTIVSHYQGKRFNSPNDATYDRAWNLYFTDPPYGLENRMQDPLKEMDFQGVFRYSNAGELTLLAADIPRPNGIGLSPDERKLYVASSEGSPKWSVFELNADGSVASQSVFYDESALEGKGAPDGLKVDKKGNIWATGPGGVWIFNPEGKVLGRILTGEATSNCAFDENEEVLYMTCDDYLMRIIL